MSYKCFPGSRKAILTATCAASMLVGTGRVAHAAEDDAKNSGGNVVIRLTLTPSFNEEAGDVQSEPVQPQQPTARSTPSAKPGISRLWTAPGFLQIADEFSCRLEEASGSSRKQYQPQSPDPISLPTGAEATDALPITAADIKSVSPEARSTPPKAVSSRPEPTVRLGAPPKLDVQAVQQLQKLPRFAPSPDTEIGSDAHNGRFPEHGGIQENRKSDKEAPAADADVIALGEGERLEVGPDEKEDVLSLNEGEAAGEECPGSPESDLPAQAIEADDLPLEQNEHPYDAPAARSTPNSGATKRLVDTTTTTEDEVLRERINAVLHYYLTHPENVSQRGPWALMHAALPFGVETEVIAGNQRVNALGWMCYNGMCAKQRMFQPTKQGFRTNVGAGVQGHEGQFLAILAQSSVQADYPILIGKRRYTIMDLVKYEMSTCREKSELTFKLIGLSHYLDPNVRWRDSRGHAWDLEKMVAEELAQPVVGAACGGTHRLMGLSYSLLKRQRAGLPINGHWQRAEVFLNDFVSYAMSLQNPDGSFSTEWFEGRGQAADTERKVQTTGHILEWLIFTVSDEHLRSPRIQASVEFLLDSVGADPARDWPIGPRGHALRALALYNQRVFGAEVGKMRSFVANAESPAVAR